MRLVCVLVLTTVACASKPSPQPPGQRPRVAPKLAPSNRLEPLRIKGRRLIAPSKRVRLILAARGESTSRLRATAQLCLSRRGIPYRVRMLASSGFTSYDNRIRDSLYAWRYRPYLVNGTPQPVCTWVTFVFTQDNTHDRMFQHGARPHR